VGVLKVHSVCTYDGLPCKAFMVGAGLRNFARSPICRADCMVVPRNNMCKLLMHGSSPNNHSVIWCDFDWNLWHNRNDAQFSLFLIRVHLFHVCVNRLMDMHYSILNSTIVWFWFECVITVMMQVSFCFFIDFFSVIIIWFYVHRRLQLRTWMKCN